jgi:ApaG protein
MEKYAFSVSVQTAYLPDQSSIEDSRFAFAYTVTITNTGKIAAQLISRHWVITDSNNKVQEVKGLGVVGAQPLLQPKESFEYTSGTVLNTADGEMRGTYQITATDGTQFEAIIAPFVLMQTNVLETRVLH